MKIKGFCIERLYGSFSLKGHFGDRVNILVGNNGSHKTTLLVSLYGLLTSKGLPNHYSIANAKIDMANPAGSVDYGTAVGAMADLQNKAKGNHAIVEAIDKFIKDNPQAESPNVRFRMEQTHYLMNGKDVSQKVFSDALRIDFISTFDVEEQEPKDGKTLLDGQLARLQSEYSYYLSDLAKQMTDIISEKGNISKEQLAGINRQKDLLAEFVNAAFSKTGKQLMPNVSKLTFRFEDGSTINADKLSAGEKQLLILLLTTLLEREQETIVLMDEPENSLHIEWQYNLLNWLTQLNPNAQFILTTHSPSIFADGWGDCALYMEDITTRQTARDGQV